MNEKDWKNRTELLIGSEAVQKLADARVLIAGLGGVGAYAAEQLCRAGIGELTLVDSDIIQPGNRNRQIIALRSTEGMKKTDAFKQRLSDINPELKLHIISEFIDENNVDKLFEQSYTYIVDAIDTLTPKVALLERAVNNKLNVVSAMGAGGRMSPEKIEIAGIEKSHHCKFASIVRKYLHRKGIYKGITVVFSSENVPEKAMIETGGEGNKRSIVGTISYMPAIFGCYCASVVINSIISTK